ncbi:immunoglobulin-like domain-containing protein [uncultured Cocleimonas sp.]|uniref:immunoglobulin-like domain-containing protein n=1 Tax=uncultured Cocleimonas sp. TaxID=1051587 RepID=UPI00261DB9EF|nr:immunoglobulin-like domain-containing protein [uncultured Cocleimonas sp.]
MKKIIFTLSVLTTSSAFAQSQDSSIWQHYSDSESQTQPFPNLSSANKFSAIKALKKHSLLLDEVELQNRLNQSKDLSLKNIKANESSNNSNVVAETSVEIDLPLPDGSFVKVKAFNSPILSKELAEKYPEIKTWRVVGADDPSITGRIDFTSKGFHGMLVMSDGDTIYIDPDADKSGNVYSTLSKRDNADHFHTEFNCQVHDHHPVNSFTKITESAQKLAQKILASSPALDLKTYRFAAAGTAEYTASQGGTPASAYASMVTTVNRVNQIYQNDLGIRLELVSGEQMLYTEAATDPYTNNNASSLVDENMANMTSTMGLSNFDLGHVFAQGSLGGLAYIGVACLDSANTSNGITSGIKAGGATGTIDPQGEIFSIEYVAHEVGHQLGASHTFNSTQNGCGGGNRTGETAVEPGSGSTVMSYSGLCGSDDIQYNSEAYFHFASISQINEYTRSDLGSTCGTNTSTGNQNPTANAGSDINIPANTPFLLDGSSTGGSSYTWDQTDTGSASPVDVDMGNNAIIRSLLPGSEQDRFIPNLNDLFADTSTVGEKLPQTTRELNFTYVVRDGNGGIGTDDKKINVTDTHSTFSVVSQSSSETLSTGQSISVLWNTASTNVAPVNCAKVDIQLIRSNGVKNMLLADTDNDGNQQLTIPGSTPTMSGARMMVSCSDNSFFNISKGNISIEKGVGVSEDLTPPVITLQGVNPVSIPQGSVYTDEGATAIDDVDGAVTVSTSGTVNTAVVGTYTITYNAEDDAGNSTSKTREVNVIKAAPEETPDVVVENTDTTAPVIAINGESSITLTTGATYVDEGASALDNVDGVITVTVTGIGAVDTSKAGEYIITYTAKDAAGNTTVVKRTVVVEAVEAHDDQVPVTDTNNEEDTVTDTSTSTSVETDKSTSSSGGGSFGFLLIPLLGLARLRRFKK